MLAVPFYTPGAPKESAEPSCDTFLHSLHPQRECRTLLRYLSLLQVPSKGVYAPLALPFTTPRGPKGSAKRSCGTFHCSKCLQRECMPLLRYLLLLPAAPKGVQNALAVPFTAPSAYKGSACPSCGTFHYSKCLQRECRTLLRYLSLLQVPSKGVYAPLALPFTTPGGPKGSAERSCGTFLHSLHPQRECILRFRYLLLLPAAPKGVHSVLAIPFYTPRTFKGSAYCAFVTFYYSPRPQRECKTLLRYLSLLPAPSKGVHSVLAIPFYTHCTLKGSAFPSCDTFHCSKCLQRECIPLLRYLSLLQVPSKGVHPPLAVPFYTHCTLKGSAFPSCDTFHCSKCLQRECIPLLRYLSLLQVPSKGAHTALALPYTTPGGPKGSACPSCGTFHYSQCLKRGCILLLRYLSLFPAPSKGAHLCLCNKGRSGSIMESFLRSPTDI